MSKKWYLYNKRTVHVIYHEVLLIVIINNYNFFPPLPLRPPPPLSSDPWQSSYTSFSASPSSSSSFFLCFWWWWRLLRWWWMWRWWGCYSIHTLKMKKEKELHLLYDIQNRIANQMKTVTTTNYIKHFAYSSRKWNVFLGGVLQENECSDIYNIISHSNPVAW